MNKYQLFATCPKAMEALLQEELETLGADQSKQVLAGVAFEATLETAYRVCLWTRIANRVLLVLNTFKVHDQQDLYAGIYKINWFEHMRPDDTFAVSFTTRGSVAINNTHFGALKVKDALVDQMRVKFNKRPSINTYQPDIRIHVHLHGEKAELSLGLSGESLHRRGYREVNIEAPIKENLAAAMLYRSQWLAIAHQGGTLLDPMCGSGTLLLEAAMQAADFAPGLLRKHYGFLGWKKHEAMCWQQLLDEAEQRKIQGLEKMPVIVGYDQSRRAINIALKHIENAGLSDKIHVERRDIKDAYPAESWLPGLLICNPPYGERLGSDEEVAELYRSFGEVLKAHFINWQATLIISDPEMGFRLGIRSKKPLTLFNGAIECKLLRMNIKPTEFFIPKAKSQQERLQQISQGTKQPDENLRAEMFANRLKKNLKKFSKWARGKEINCYRLYDADLPEYAVAVDVYQGEKCWVNVQEYEAPKTVSAQKADQRLAAAMVEIPDVLGIDSEQVFLKIRRRQNNREQYEKRGEAGSFFTVEEHGCQFLINLSDYLDTGLFLDHRPMRKIIQQQAKGKRFLNLFAYTGSATVHAAVGGAVSSMSVDMSKTYMDWAKKNLTLNNIQGDHEIVQADCLEWLENEIRKPDPAYYDLIFLDPPTFSNSKRMADVFDIQRDHAQLIKNVSQLLAPGGVLYFSTNFKRFKLDITALEDLTVEDISAQTIPDDFARNRKIHYCWRIQE